MKKYISGQTYTYLHIITKYTFVSCKFDQEIIIKPCKTASNYKSNKYAIVGDSKQRLLSLLLYLLMYFVSVVLLVFKIKMSKILKGIP